ncbi:MAG TPA: MASE4 domain-containing protein [Methylomirabilota bacterium]
MARDEISSADTWLVDLRPTARQTRSAFAVAALAAVGFVAVAPFAGRPLAMLNALFPALDAIVFVTDLVTAALLFAQYSISRSRSLLALATGYLFTAFIVVPHALTLAGAFTPVGLLGAGIQTGSWLFIFWHVGYAVGLLAYAGLREDKPPAPVSDGSALPAIGWSLGGVVAGVLGLTWLSTAGASLLPPIILDQSRMSPIVVYPIWFTILISAAAIAVLWWRRRRSVLDEWLMVVALVFIAELVFSGLLPTVRFSLGFYAGRVFSVMTSSIVLVVMLGETTRLYMRLAHSNAMLRREQDNKLMTMEAMAASISHEVRQPMAAISANSAAAIRLIQQEPPDLADAVSALEDVQVDTGRANEILQDIRALFGKGSQRQERIDINETAVAALRALRGWLVERGVSVRSELSPDVPSIVGHRSQLQEVIINLLQNAVEAMDTIGGNRRVLTVRTKCDGEGAIVVEVEDTGRGIDAKSLNKVFDAFVTTKPGGMGLGLAICRTIIDRHGGRLSASPAHPRGTVFRIVLPRGAVPP